MISHLLKGLVVAAAALAFAGAAQAHDGSYIRGDIGYGFDGEFDVKDNGVVDYGALNLNEGWVGSFGGGYAFPGGFRLEGEVAYRDNDLDEGDTIDLGGETSSWAVMANGYFDFNKGNQFEPYIGAGIGYASVDVNAGDGFPVLHGFDDSEQVWAWQAMVGLAFEVGAQTVVDVSYRYFEAPSLEFATDELVKREGDYIQHAAMIGVRYTFAPPYEPPPPPPPPAPTPYVASAPPPPAACPTSEFVVYFEWDSATLNQAGQDTIMAAVNRAKQCNITKIDVVGHTDTSGSPEYNEGLSGRRAAVVNDALVAGGIQTTLIRTEARGEADLARATADGVREPLNRRSAVTISFH